MPHALPLTNSERQQLRQLQKQRRDGEGYVKVAVVLLLDEGRSAASIAEDLGLDEGTVYRYAQTFTHLGLEKYLAHERPGYWARQKIINAIFYHTKEQFRQAVLDFFTRLEEFGQELVSLCTLNFHLLDSRPTS